jgi:hypothetical protein
LPWKRSNPGIRESVKTSTISSVKIIIEAGTAGGYPVEKKRGAPEGAPLSCPCFFGARFDSTKPHRVLMP